MNCVAPRVGFEPTTCGLTVRRSTDWAIGESRLRILRNSTKNARAFKKLFCSLKTKRQYNDVLERTPLLTTPPHLWRKFVVNYRLGSLERNTSTYVEKIFYVPLRLVWDKKHLHIRGENSTEPISLSASRETPPHTWRKSTPWYVALVARRNTSTYVEKMGTQLMRGR